MSVSCLLFSILGSACVTSDPADDLGVAARAPALTEVTVVRNGSGTCESLASLPATQQAMLERVHLAAWLDPEDWAAAGITEARSLPAPAARLVEQGSACVAASQSECTSGSTASDQGVHVTVVCLTTKGQCTISDLNVICTPFPCSGGCGD